jgi:hypothetical protein
MLVLMMGGLMKFTAVMAPHEITYIPVFMKMVAGCKTLFFSLRGCNAGIAEGSRSLNIPLRWSYVAGYTY